jgi:hypothetical protein
MRKAYRMFRRGRVFWCQNNQTGKQESLRIKDRAAAERLVQAKNEAQLHPTINLQIARAYLVASDPAFATRTWQFVMDEILKLKVAESENVREPKIAESRGNTIFGAVATTRRWRVAVSDKAFDGLRALPLLETRAEDLLRAIENGKTSANVYLRRIHNFALGMNWIPVPIIPKKNWPKLTGGGKRAITAEVHAAKSEHTPLSTVPKIAVVFSTGAQNSTGQLGEMLTTAIEEALLSKGFALATRSEVSELQKEIDFQHSGITSAAGAARVGHALNVQGLVTIRVNAAVEEEKRYNWETFLLGKHSDLIGTAIEADITLRLLRVEPFETLWVGSQNIAGLFKNSPPIDVVCVASAKRIIAELPPLASERQAGNR